MIVPDDKLLFSICGIEADLELGVDVYCGACTLRWILFVDSGSFLEKDKKLVQWRHVGQIVAVCQDTLPPGSGDSLQCVHPVAELSPSIPRA